MRPFLIAWLFLANTVIAQQPPYDVAPEVRPPYYRVRYEGSAGAGRLKFPVRYTVGIPPQTRSLRGVVVHQHGCGEGSCQSGLTGAFDLHWQALARKHDCALLAASYEQPQDADYQLWCDPRNGSDTADRLALSNLGEASGHSELSSVPWALWGHSGGATWVGSMTLLHPDRVHDGKLTWQAQADPESGIASFLIERDGQPIATVPAKPNNPFGRPVFQGLQYSDTPTQPLSLMEFFDSSAAPGRVYDYRVIAVNTAGLKSL